MYTRRGWSIDDRYMLHKGPDKAVGWPETYIYSLAVSVAELTRVGLEAWPDFRNSDSGFHRSWVALWPIHNLSSQGGAMRNMQQVRLYEPR